MFSVALQSSIQGVSPLVLLITGIVTSFAQKKVIFLISHGGMPAGIGVDLIEGPYNWQKLRVEKNMAVLGKRCNHSFPQSREVQNAG